MNETEQLVTKDFLKGELQQVRTEIQQLRGDLFQQLRADQRWTVALIIGVYATNIAILLAILFKSH
jgi:hypothetical protein